MVSGAWVRVLGLKVLGFRSLRFAGFWVFWAFKSFLFLGF